MASLRITLLGGFEARFASGEAVVLAGRKSQALLAYLALIPGEACPRDKLIGLLWSDRGESQARGSLRKALAEVRKALSEVDPAPLKADRDEVTLDADAVEVDAVELERLVADGAPEALESATELYRGDLLDGIAVHDPAFEDWLRSERERLHDRAREAFSRLLDYQTGIGTNDTAIATARRLLALDPLQESTHRALMKLYADQGDRAMALKQYQACREALRAEFRLQPDTETERLADEIREGVPETDEAEKPASSPAAAAEPLALPGKPSIAVLPFVNMSDDPEQEYFSDGITEDVITELSRFHSLFVIARNSSFTYKGRAVDVRDIGRELGVRYLVEGSVRKSGQRIRVTAQLLEAETGNHLWAEHYDRELEDIFAVQDEVVGAIVGALGGRLLEAQKEQSFRKKTGNLDAYDYYLRGLHFWRKYDPENNLEALRLFETAVTHDPGFAEAHALLAFAILMNYWWQAESSGETFDRPLALARKSVELDPHNSLCHAVLGYIHLVRREHEHGRHHIETALSLNPHDYLSISFYAMLLWWTGNPEKALLQVEAAQRFEPFPPSWHWENRGGPLYQLGRFEEAAESFEKIPNVSWWNHGYLAACYGQLSDLGRARHNWQQALRLRPGTSFEDVAKSAPFKNQADEELWLEGLRKAGLPE